MINIEYSAYVLKKVGVNASRVGALLKVQWPEGIGYADLHPWPELGDAYIKEQLKVLSEHVRSNQQTQLSSLQRQALYFSHLDAQTRAEKKSLFAGLEVPTSHFLVTREEQVSSENLAEVERAGYTAMKVKIGGEPLITAISVAELAGQTSLKLRLDVNAKWSASEFKSFADKIPREFKTRIEFVEDPFHSAQSHWGLLSQTYEMKFARDFEFGNEYAVRILKPAAEGIFEIARAEKSETQFVVTSYLDHPVGQAFAAYTAAKFKQEFKSRLSVCGLLSQNTYETSEFSSEIDSQGPEFKIPSGTGVGFDELLQKTRWQNLR